jgi:predicted DNA-binding transcriptional regulator YafY
MERNWIITIIYLKGSEITKRDIKVLKITGDYVKAFCYLRNQTRIFRKDNILSASFYRKSSA